MSLIIVIYFYIRRILHSQVWKLFRLEAYFQTRCKLKMHIIACYIKTSTNYLGSQGTLDGIANSESLRVLSKNYPTMCARIIWMIVIVGQGLTFVTFTLTDRMLFWTFYTKRVCVTIRLVWKLENIHQVFTNTYKETFICKIFLFVNSPTHRNFKLN